MKREVVVHPSRKPNEFDGPHINLNFNQSILNFNFPGLSLLIVTLCGFILKKRKNEIEPESKAIPGDIDVEETLITLDRKLRLEVKPKIIELSGYNQSLFRWYKHSFEDFLESVHELKKIEDKVAPSKVFELRGAINYFAKEVNEETQYNFLL